MKNNGIFKHNLEYFRIPSPEKIKIIINVFKLLEMNIQKEFTLE